MHLEELLVRVLSDSPIPWDSVDGVYLFGETQDNESSVLDRAARIWMKTRCQILVCDGETDHGYPGYKLWREGLIMRSVPSQWIFPIHTLYEIGVNTLTEAQSLVREAGKNQWKTLVISAAPFHQLRAFITTVSVLLKESPLLRVYNQVGLPLSWNETARHSQGILTRKRSELIHSEFERIERYHQKGDLISPEEVLAYLEERDAKEREESCR